VVENWHPCLWSMKSLISHLQKENRKTKRERTKEKDNERERERERQLSGVWTAAAVLASVGDRHDSICLPDTSTRYTSNHHSGLSITDVQSCKQTNTDPNGMRLGKQNEQIR